MSDYFVHALGVCEASDVGPGTRIWAFAHVLPGARIGADCNICDHVFIENDVVVGDRVTVKSGVQLWNGTRLADDVFVGPNATFTNDPFPRSRQYPESFPETVVGHGASIGANATILPGLRVGRGAMVGAGAVVTKNVPPYAIVAGNPGRIIGYAGQRGTVAGPAAPLVPVEPHVESHVDGVAVVSPVRADDLRGSLIAFEFDRLPFEPKRIFAVFGVPTREVRGEHAHRQTHQLLVALQGTVGCIADDGEGRQDFRLDRPEVALYLPPMTWGTQYNYSADCVLLVIASHPYSPDDYIRDYEVFLAEKHER
jgi:UDP-2-acetamido-3-amino-2,3-dideoxy-glucuronate N-acetyltransferase